MSIILIDFALDLVKGQLLSCDTYIVAFQFSLDS